MGARPLQVRTGTRESSGLRRAGADELEVDEAELLDTSEFAALSAEEEERARAAERPAPRQRPTIHDALTVRVDAEAATKATVPTPTDARAELKALRRETLARIAAERRASRPDVSPAPEEPAPLEVKAPASPEPKIDASPRPAPTLPASTPVRRRPVGPLPPPTTPPRKEAPSSKKEPEDAASEATTVPVAKLRVRRAADPDTRPRETLQPPSSADDRADDLATPGSSSLPWRRIATVALVALGMFGVGRWLSRDREPTTPPVAPSGAAPAESQGAAAQREDAARDTPAPERKLETPTAEPASPPVGASERAASASATPPMPSISPRTEAGAAKPTGSIASKPSDPKAIDPAAAPPTQGLDSAAASHALARAAARAASCTDPKGGQGMVSVTFDPDGTASHVAMSGPYEGTPVASCVVQIFRSASVPPFEGAPSRVFQTVKLPGDGKTLQ